MLLDHVTLLCCLIRKTIPSTLRSSPRKDRIHFASCPFNGQVNASLIIYWALVFPGPSGKCHPRRQVLRAWPPDTGLEDTFSSFQAPASGFLIQAPHSQVPFSFQFPHSGLHFSASSLQFPRSVFRVPLSVDLGTNFNEFGNEF